MDRGFHLLPESASTYSRDVDALWWFEVSVSAFFALLIFALIVFLALRYRRSRHPQAAVIHGSTALELLWSGIPLGLALGMFVWGARVHFRIARPPADAMDIYVTGKQWMWKHQHPGGQREINDLHVPVATAVRLTMISEDVIHSWFVPAFRMKRDVVPGRYSTAWFEATKTGTYDLFCAEYCGTKHSKMIGHVHVLEQEDYQRWLAANRPAQTAAELGRQVYERLRCGSCHDGDQARGPSLAGRFGGPIELSGGGRAVFDQAYLRESVFRPLAAQAAGWEANMPSYQGQISEEEVLQIGAWLQTLEPAGEERP